ncbi:MAG: single-stranded DNA-binding protein [Spirochaetaceae bacterium]|nr:single-stranded DNA-binding protein [Spirochaetaceae bacterium]
MNNLNSVLLEGNLTRDPELRYTAKGTAVCRFSIACNRSYKQEDQRQEEVSYFDVTTWSRLAEICAEYLVKGRGVRVVGRLKQDRWEDDSGNRRSRVEVIAEHVEFKPQRRDEAETSPEAEAILPEPEPAQATA